MAKVVWGARVAAVAACAVGLAAGAGVWQGLYGGAGGPFDGHSVTVGVLAGAAAWVVLWYETL